MTTTFILSGSSTALPTSSGRLNLLPFALGSSSDPYATTSAPTSTYFLPRPAPPNFPLVPAGTPIASFRGRTLVSQDIGVPKGYKGVILSTSKRPDRGGLEERRSGNSDNGAKWPLTPAASTASAGDADDASTASGPTSLTGRPVRATRGAGQVAYARPKTRTAKRTATRKRMRMDSDDEDENDVQIAEQTAGADTEDVKMERTTRSTPKKRARTVPEVLPSITVQAPTPKKASTIAVGELGTGVTLFEAIEEEQDGIEAASNSADNLSVAAKAEQDVPETPKVEDNIVPSPATENDLPMFSTEPPATEATKPPQAPETQALAQTPQQEEPPVRREEANAQEEANAPDQAGYFDQAVRVLRPTATFESIALWTADAPLAGFRADEGEVPAAATAHSTEEPSVDEAKPAEGETTAPAPGKGWWRVGGAGEGGDEFVRGLGEWLGLVEMVSFISRIDRARGDRG